MQSAGRAVTCSCPPALLYSSSRHALSRPACHSGEGAYKNKNKDPSTAPSQLDYTWNAALPIVFASPNARRDLTWRSGSPVVFSHAADQKRCASSSSSSSAPKSKPAASPQLVYKGREAAALPGKPAPKRIDPRIPNANPYTNYRGRTHAPSSPAHASSTVNDIAGVFGPTKRTIQVVQRQPQPPPRDDPPAPPSSAPPAQTTPLQTPSSQPPPISPQSPIHSTPAQELGYAPDDVQVFQGVAAESQTRSEGAATLHEQHSSPALDEIARLRQEKAELYEALQQQEEKHQHLQQKQNQVQSSLEQKLSQLEKELDHTQKDLQSTIAEQGRKLNEANNTIARQEAGLQVRDSRIREIQREVERDPINRQQKRRLVERQFDATDLSRQQQQQAQDRRKHIRKDYETFRAAYHNLTRISGALVRDKDKDLLHAPINWYNREMVYWNKALKAAQSFEEKSKRGDKARFWDAGEQVQTKTTNPKDQEVLRQGVIHQLKVRLQHRDSVLTQVKAFVRASGSKAERARLDYVADLGQLETSLETVQQRQHDHRRLIRATRFDMDPTKTSPELSAHERASTLDVYELDRPIADMLNVINARMDYWVEKKAEIQRDGSKSGIRLRNSFCTSQQNMLGAAQIMLRTLRHFSALQLEASEAAWVAEQPLHQQVLWQNRTRVSRRQVKLLNRMKILVGWLRGVGMQHPIMSTEKIANFVPRAISHGVAAFADAYLRHKRNAFTLEDERNVKHTFDSYANDNASDVKSLLKRLQPVLDELSSALGNRPSIGKRLLVPAMPSRTKRRENLRKAAAAAAKHKAEEEASQKADKTRIEPGATESPLTDSRGSAASKTMTSKDTGSESTTDPQNDQPPQSETTTSPTTEAASTEPAKSVSVTLDEPEGPRFKLNRQTSASLPRLAPKSTTIYSRARSRLGFKPPRPMFKESGRRSQEHGSSPADLLDQAENRDALKSLEYQIPAQDLRAALIASKSSQAAYWRYSLYKSPAGEKPIMHYCTKFDQSENVAKHFIGEKVIGFDLEWEMGASLTQGSIKDNVSLIQIACDNRVALFQVAMFVGDTVESLMPPTLRTILESPDIIKAGVNIAGDFTRLRKFLGIEGQGIFELSHLYRLVKYSEKDPAKVNRKPFKLAEQVQDILYLPLYKGNVRTSAWSRRLKGEQTDYAASDAYAGFRLFHELDRVREAMNPMPPRPAYHELYQPIILGNGEVAGETGKKRKATLKNIEIAGEASTLTAEEEEALKDEEEEAQEEAGAEEVEDVNADDELEDQNTETATVVKYEAADEWLARYESSLSPEKKGKALPTSIRAYALWHIQGLELEQVAEAMRQPPLALSTVASYVLEIIKSENQPYDAARVEEAVGATPAVTQWRYRTLLHKARSEAADKKM